MACPFLFDLAVTAENYGQMTGVLAGFAFTALVLLLAPTKTVERAPLALIGSFIALVLATLTYSLIAGDTAELARPRAATLELVGGLIFGLAVISLLQGLHLVMRGSGVDASTVRVTRFNAVVVFPGLVVFFIVQAGADTVALRAAAAGRPCIPEVPGIGVGLTVLSVAILSLSLLRPAQRMLARHASPAASAAPILVIVASVAGAAAAGEFCTHAPDFLMSPRALDLYLVGVTVLVTTVGLMFSAAGTTSPKPSPPQPAGPRRIVPYTFAHEVTQEFPLNTVPRQDWGVRFRRV
ncbi:hypothetical protein [Actinoplanes rectilineatus]|uniref:hypothetical protein n=1 Tax=Actinoplanes rectilineatus TaxID=113571 RepID=UPI0005F2DEF2|nr:hypothetical protein [Actinoplanes rectilineatus]